MVAKATANTGVEVPGVEGDKGMIDYMLEVFKTNLSLPNWCNIMPDRQSILRKVLILKVADSVWDEQAVVIMLIGLSANAFY